MCRLITASIIENKCHIKNKHRKHGRAISSKFIVTDTRTPTYKSCSIEYERKFHIFSRCHYILHRYVVINNINITSATARHATCIKRQFSKRIWLDFDGRQGNQFIFKRNESKRKTLFLERIVRTCFPTMKKKQTFLFMMMNISTTLNQHLPLLYIKSQNALWK